MTLAVLFEKGWQECYQGHFYKYFFRHVLMISADTSISKISTARNNYVYRKEEKTRNNMSSFFEA